MFPIYSKRISTEINFEFFDLNNFIPFQSEEYVPLYTLISFVFCGIYMS